MNTIQLECFLAVSENLNFARAAEQLHITQPAVTHQIHSLETELNTRLFVRTTRSVELTPAGFAFISDASDILGRTRAAKARFSGGTPGQISEFLSAALGCRSRICSLPSSEISKKTFPNSIRSSGRLLYPSCRIRFWKKLSMYCSALRKKQKESENLFLFFQKRQAFLPY